MRLKEKIWIVAAAVFIVAFVFVGCNSAEQSAKTRAPRISPPSPHASRAADSARKSSTAPAPLACWRFDVPGEPGRDCSGNGLNLKINGDPIVKNGEILLHGGSVRLPKIKQDFLYSSSNALKLGTGSFSVGCWFKSSKITYMKLIGTRDTIRLCYKNRGGWALGLSKADSSIIFVLNGKNGAQSAAKVKIVDSSWENDVWNQLVGVRDVKNKTIKLYVNGKLAATAPDAAGDVTVTRDLTVGLDSYAGCLTEGAFKEIRITRAVPPPDLIAAEYAKARPPEMNVIKKELRDAPPPIPKRFRVDPTDGLNGKIDIQPTPFKLACSGGFSKLPSPVHVRVPKNAKATTLEAKRIIVDDLERLLGIKVASGEAATNSHGAVIALKETSASGVPESYHLAVAVGPESAAVEISSADNGMLYGAMTLSEIIAQSSLIMNGVPSIPKSLEISDHPAIRHRIHVRILPKGGKCSDAAIERAMRSVARKRMNFYSVHLMEYSEKNMRRMVDIAGKHGVKILATVGYMWLSRKLGRAATLEDFKEVERKFEMAAKAGVGGFSLHFDDLGSYGRNAARYPDGVGAFQRRFITPVREIARGHGIDFVSVCPTMYMRDWRKSAETWFGDPKRYADYFEKISRFDKGDVEVFHCDLSAESVADLKKLSVAKPSYYLNGVWTSYRWFSYYVGPPRLAWSWYGFKIDPFRGPVADSAMMKQWKSFERIGVESVWVGAGGFVGPATAGVWMWNPEKFDENSAVREVNRVAGLGAGTFAPLMRYERNMLPLVSLFMTYVNGATSECHPVELKLDHPLNQEDMLRYWRNYKAAELAAAEIKAIVAKRRSNLEKPYLPYGVHNRPGATIRRMNEALKAFRVKLIRKMRRFNIEVK